MSKRVEQKETKEAKLRKGDRVIVRINSMTKAAGIAGKTGTIVGPDPLLNNRWIRAVKLDSDCEVNPEKTGLHIHHLRIIK